MKKARCAAVALCMALVLCLGSTSFANPSDCQDAISQYDSAISDISSALRRYTNCVSAAAVTMTAQVNLEGLNPLKVISRTLSRNTA
jgi:hypothetical protein